MREGEVEGLTNGLFQPMPAGEGGRCVHGHDLELHGEVSTHARR